MAEIITVEVNTDKAIKDLVEATKKTEELRAKVKQLEQAEGDNSEAIARARAELAVQTKERKALQKQVEANIAANNKEENSYDQISAMLSDVTIRWRRMSEAERENTEAGRALTAQKLELNEKLKALDKSTGNAGRNVGFYKEGILEAFEATNQFGTGADAVVGGLGEINGALLKIVANPIGAVIAALVIGITTLYKAFASTQSGADDLAVVWGKVGAVAKVLTGEVAKLARGIVDAFSNPKKAIEDFGQLITDYVQSKIEAAIKLGGLLGEVYDQVFSGKFTDALKTAKEAASLFVDELTPIGDAKKLYEAAAEGASKLGATIDKATQAAEAQVRAQISLEKLQIRLTTQVERTSAELEKYKSLSDDSTTSLQAQARAAQQAVEVANRYYSELAQLENARLKVIQNQIAVEKAAGEVSRVLFQEKADQEAKLIQIEAQKQQEITQLRRTAQQAQQDILELDLDVFIDFNDTQKTILERQANDQRRTFDERFGLIEKAKKLTQSSFDAQIGALTKFGADTTKLQELFGEQDSIAFARKMQDLELSEAVQKRVIEIFRERATAQQDFADAEAALQTEQADKRLQKDVTIAQAQLEVTKNNIFQKLDAERLYLDAQLAAETAQAEKVGASTLAINAKYSEARKELDKAEFNAKLELASGFAGNLAQIFGEQTAIGKAAAVAQTTIATYQSATESYKSFAGLGPIGVVLGAAAAAAAIASGIANVRKILAVKSGLPGDSSKGGGGGISGSVPNVQAAPNLGQQATLGLNQGIISRNTIQGQQAQGPSVAVVVDTVTAKQQTNSDISKAATI